LWEVEQSELEEERKEWASLECSGTVLLGLEQSVEFEVVKWDFVETPLQMKTIQMFREFQFDK
jgi:hypothetical protein